MGHANLSQPLSSANAACGLASQASAAKTKYEYRIKSTHSDHDVGSLDDGSRRTSRFQPEIIDRFVRDRRGDDRAAAYVDSDMRRGRSFRDFDNLAGNLISRADLHLFAPLNPMIRTMIGWQVP